MAISRFIMPTVVLCPAIITAFMKYINIYPTRIKIAITLDLVLCAVFLELALVFALAIYP